MYTSVFRELLTYMIEDPRNISPALDLIAVAKHLERMADHATNIAEKIHYMMHGQRINRLPARGLRPLPMMKPLVLVVEDEAALQQLLAYNLERAGFAVEQAYDSDEALTLIAERTPDLVLLDWMLPWTSGLELCRQLRRKPATANLPIIMLTARTEEADRLQGLDTGADDYITKPFSIEELLARIRAVLRRVRPAFAAETLAFADLTMDLVAAPRRARARARSTSARPSSACCASFSRAPAACSRATSCSTWCGARTRTWSCARSTRRSAACAARSTPAASPTSCAPCARPATPSTTPRSRATRWARAFRGLVGIRGSRLSSQDGRKSASSLDLTDFEIEEQ